MHLYMIRHGQSYVNLKDWADGNTDAPLTELGQKQASLLSAWLPNQIRHVDTIYCSTMRRAIETAQPVAEMYGLPIHYDDRLREIGNNKLDHTPWPNDNLPEYGNIWGSESPFQPITLDANSESLMHFRTRIGIFIEELVQRHHDETILAFCHGGVIEVSFDHIFNIGPWRHCEVRTDNTGIAHFQYVAHPTRETWRLLSHNQLTHLQPALNPEE